MDPDNICATNPIAGTRSVMYGVNKLNTFALISSTPSKSLHTSRRHANGTMVYKNIFKQDIVKSKPSFAEVIFNYILAQLFLYFIMQYMYMH